MLLTDGKRRNTLKDQRSQVSVSHNTQHEITSRVKHHPVHLEYTRVHNIMPWSRPAPSLESRRNRLVVVVQSYSCRVCSFPSRPSALVLRSHKTKPHHRTWFLFRVLYFYNVLHIAWFNLRVGRRNLGQHRIHLVDRLESVRSLASWVCPIGSVYVFFFLELPHG